MSTVAYYLSDAIIQENHSEYKKDIGKVIKIVIENMNGGVPTASSVGAVTGKGTLHTMQNAV